MTIADPDLRRLAVSLLRGLPSHGSQPLPRLLTRIDPGADSAMALRIAAHFEALRGSRAVDPAFPVAVPGDRMCARRAMAQRDGIDVPVSLMNNLQALSAA